MQSIQKDLGQEQEIQFEPPYIDRMIHEAVMENVKVAIQPVPGDEAQARSILGPKGGDSIHLSVHEFEQAPHYRYFNYEMEKEPEMIVYDDCVVCKTKVMPASCLANREGRQFLTLGLCPVCGFLQHSRRPPKSWYANFYRKMWDPGARSSEWPETVSLRPEPVNNLYSYCRPGQRVLEIGSGWGSVLLTFKKAGFEPCGIEATEHRSAFIRERLGIPCFTGEAEEAPIGKDFFQPKSFDLIISTNVLEHVYNTRQVIEHTYALLKDDGMAYLEVPIYSQENLTLNTHGVSHTCNFSHANFFYLLQTIGFDLVKDCSDPIMVRFLVRKAPPLTEEQRRSKLGWMSTFLPHRALAYILEKNGLARVPKNPETDLSLDLEWFLDALGQKNLRFLRLKFDFLRQSAPALNALRNAILKKKPLEIVSNLLPIQYVYNAESVPIWYY